MNSSLVVVSSNSSPDFLPLNAVPLFPRFPDRIYGDIVRNINYFQREPPGAVDAELGPRRGPRTDVFLAFLIKQHMEQH